MAEEDHEGLARTLGLLSIPGFLESANEAKREVAEGESIAMENLLKSGRQTNGG